MLRSVHDPKLVTQFYSIERMWMADDGSEIEMAWAPRPLD